MTLNPSRCAQLLLSLSILVVTGCGGGGESTAPNNDAIASHEGGKTAIASAKPTANLARWSAPVQLPLVPSAGAVLDNGKVLMWSSYSRTGIGDGTFNTYTALFDPLSGTVAERNITNTNHDMFCPGTSRLPDGRLMVAGGVTEATVSLYDPLTDAWSNGPALRIPRGYNANTVLADGSVLTIGGSFGVPQQGGKNAEIWSPGGSGRVLSGVPYDPYLLDGVFNGWQTDAHTSIIPTGNGRVLMAGPSVNMAWIDTRGNGSSTPAGRRGDDTPSLGGPTVMYEAGKILKVGGATWNGNVPANANAYLIDTTRGTADVKKLAPMAYPRMYANAVALPDGQVMVVGGQTYVQEFSDSNAVLAPELWDPATERFTVLPPMSVARNYHSIAMLLPDARVLSAGGGLCNCAGDHPDLQILSPPYLFNDDGSTATRPVIRSAPTQVGYGTSIAVTTDSPVTAFSMVRMGANTHTVNNDQRRISVQHSGGVNNAYQVSIPSNPGILVPGKWMLFAMSANGTPSVAAIVTVSNTGAPVLQNPGDVTLAYGAALNLAANASTPSGALAFSATGLPVGLAINSTTGAITGTPTSLGSHFITLRASNGSQSVSTEFVVRVSSPPGTGSGLLAQYFGNRTLTASPGLQRTEAIDFDWGNGSPGGSVPADNFTARWSGTLEASDSGVTQLRTISDDGVRVWVDGRLVINNWTDHGAAADTAMLNLVAGQRYPIMVEYYEAGGGTTMRLQWQTPGAAGFAAVPASRLYAAASPATTNLALGRPSTQSSTDFGGASARAVDGSTSGAYNDGSVTHTADYGAAAREWWQVDLGRNARIDLVTLWNRTDCCADRLRNFVLFVSAADMTGRSLDQLRADPAVIVREVGTTPIAPNISLPVGASGRYVRVQLMGDWALSLAEVQVFGTPITAYRTPAIEPVANQQTAVGTAASLAIRASDPDGNALTYDASGLPPGLAINTATGVIGGTPTSGGVYAVTVGARNGGDLRAEVRFDWTVLGPLPQVNALAVAIAPIGASVSYAPALSAGAASQYSWNFGDGSADTAFAASSTAAHTFAAAGVYTVTLTIRATDGRTTTQRFTQAVIGGAPRTAARASANLMLEPRSGAPTRLWVVNQDNDSVSIFDTSTNARVAEVAVGAAPRTLALAADGRVWVVNKQGSTVSVISPSTLAVVQTVALPRASQPFGIVFSRADGSAFVSLEATGSVLKLNGSTGASLGAAAVGDNPRHLALTADGSQLLVSCFITRPLRGEGTAAVSTTSASGAPLGGEVIVLDTGTLAALRTLVLAHSERPDQENQGRGIPNYLGAAVIAPDGRSAWLPSKQDNVRRGTARDGSALNFQNTVRAISSRIDLTNNTEDLAGRVDHDNASLASAATFHPSGAYLFVALETSRQVAVVDAAGKRELFRVDVGLAPQGLVVSDDGARLYVSNFMARNVTVLDLGPLVNSGQLALTTAATLPSVGTEKLAATVLRGKQLFYDARDPRLARDSYMSCASCHNDGGHDGRTWDLTAQGEGLRNTISLRGRAGMAQGFLHWSGNFDEVQDFEGQIRGLAGGTGLMSNADFNAGTHSQPLGDRKTGLSADLDALAAYVASLSAFAPSPLRNADGSLTSAAQAGKSVFLARNCAGCHGGSAFTGSADASQLKNIGTLKTGSGQRLFAALNGIDPPTLRDVWATAPYLHDGSAATLADAVAAHNTTALGGSTLNATDLTNLVTYLQQIGSEEPAVAGLSNLALRKPAAQSSSDFGGDATRAVDGNTLGVYNNGSVSHTAYQAAPWWQVDLQSQASIASIQLWNRTDCCAARLANFTVFVSASDMSARSLAQLNADTTVWKAKVASMNGADNIGLDMRTSGRFVRVQLDATEYLSLAEVQVFGTAGAVTVSSGTSPLFGSGDGTVFTDPVAAGQVLTGITVRSGWWIDAIQGLATPANLPVHGGNGGGTYTATWPAGEYLVRIYGRFGSGGSVAQVHFVTNTGRVLGPYGTAQGQGTLTNFDYTVPAGNRVLGFTGRSSGSLNAIGVIYGP